MTAPPSAAVTTFSTPAGRPASSRIRASMSIDSGVSFAGLTTIVQPAAIAGPILRVPIASGKFHGVMNTQGPTGWRIVSRRPAAGLVRREAAVEADRLLGVPAQEARAVGDLGPRLGERLAHLERHQQRQLVGALDDRLVGAAQDVRALARSAVAPVAAPGVVAAPSASSASLRRRVGDLRRSSRRWRDPRRRASRRPPRRATRRRCKLLGDGVEHRSLGLRCPMSGCSCADHRLLRELPATARAGPPAGARHAGGGPPQRRTATSWAGAGLIA